MVSKRNRNRLIMVGAAAAASGLAFYFARKAFRAHDSDSHKDAPCNEINIEKEVLDMENLMKIKEEKPDKVEGSAEESNGFSVEEFEQFLTEEYGAVFANGAKNSLESQDSLEPTEEVCARNGEEEGNLKVGFLVNEEASHGCLSTCSDRFESCSMGNETEEEGTHSATSQADQQQLQLCCSRIEGMSSEALLTEFSSSRDVGFDELSMQDLSEGDVIFSSDSQKELEEQSSPDFEFDSCNSSIKNIDISPEGLGTELWDISDVDGLSRQSSEDVHHHEFEVVELKKPSVMEISVEEELYSGINNGVEGFRPREGLEVLLDESLETSSAMSKDPDYGISADKDQVFPQQELSNIQCLSLVVSLTETSDSIEADRHVLEGGISSSNGNINGQSTCPLEEEGQNSPRVGFNNIFNGNGESSSVASCVFHLHQQPAESGNCTNEEGSPKLDVDLSTTNENIENLSLQSPVNDVYGASDKDMDKLANHVLEDGKRLDVVVTQPPKVDSMGSNNQGLEDSTSDSVETQSSSSGETECDTLPSYVFDDALNSSIIAINEHGDPKIHAHLGDQFNGQTPLLQTFDNAHKDTRDGNSKFEEHWSQLLSLPHMGSDVFAEHPLKGIRRTSNIESSLNGDLVKQTNSLGAYDAFLADPFLSPSMKSQVSRARAIAQKLYSDREE